MYYGGVVKVYNVWVARGRMQEALVWGEVRGGLVVVAEPPQGSVSCVLGTKKEVLGEGSLHLILTEWHRVKGPD